MVNQVFSSGIINSNQTAVNPTTAAQVLGTCSISENRFAFLKVTAVVKFVTATNSTAQTLSIQFINSTGPTTLQTFVQGATATIQSFSQDYVGLYRKNDKGTITVVLAGGTADANTSVVLQGFWVEGCDSETQFLQS